MVFSTVNPFMFQIFCYNSYKQKVLHNVYRVFKSSILEKAVEILSILSGKFRWRKKYRQPNNLNKVIEFIKRYDMEDEVGYLLEVDLVNIISYKIQYLVSFLLLLLYSSIFDNKNLCIFYF